MKNIFQEGWELRYKAEFMAHINDNLRAYIRSPRQAATYDEAKCNIRTARTYMFYAFEAMNFAVVAPHVYLRVVLDDEPPSHKALALQISLYILVFSNIVFVCGDRITEEMKREIKYAAKLRKPIYTFTAEVYSAVRDIVGKEAGDPELVSLHLEHSPLGSSCPVTNYMQTELDVPPLGKEKPNAVSV